MRKEHILVVDDEEQIRMSLSVLLRDAGYRVTTAQDGRGAVNLLSCSNRGPVPVDLILTDVRMPGLSGIELIDELRRLRLTIPIVIITAFCSEELILDLKRRGSFELIQKPYDPGELLERIGLVLRSQRITED